MRQQYHDNHNHVSLYIMSENSPRIAPGMSEDQAYILLNSLSKNSLHVVTNWQLNTFDELRVDADIPVIIAHEFLHNFFINKKGVAVLKEKFGHNAVSDFVKNIYEQRDIIWMQINLPEIFVILCSCHTYDEESVERWFDDLQRVHNINSAEDMLTPSEQFLKIVQQSNCAGRCKFWVGIKEFEAWGKNHLDDIEGIKLFLDGEETSKTASITDGYKHPLPGYENGALVYTDEELAGHMRVAHEHRTGIAMHAIGDVAIDQILRVLESNDLDIPKIRIEHACYITKEQAHKCKSRGVILSMQPNFAFFTTSENDTTDVLKEFTYDKNCPFRMLIDDVGYVAGEDLIFGSDGMPQGIPADDFFESKRETLYPFMKLTMDELFKGYRYLG